MVHIGLAIGIDFGQERNDFRQIVEIFPIDQNAGGAGNGRQMQGMIGRAARGQQPNHAVNYGFLVNNVGQCAGALTKGRKRCRLRCGSAGQRVSQLGIGRHKGGTGHMQPHKFHQHLIGIGGAVKCACAGAVIAVAFGLQ